MPIYEYKCKSCKNIIEKLQKFNDKPLIICNKCKEPELIKIVSSTSFKLKGQGWFDSGGY
jgi:putative FmdB family regulatory protein